MKNTYFEWIMLQLIILILHIGIALTSAAVVLFCMNKYTLGILFVGALLVFLQLHVFDGCVMGKMEAPVPGLNMSPNEIGRAALGISESDLSVRVIEQLLVGGAVYASALKLVGVLIFEYAYGRTFYQQVCFNLNPENADTLTTFERFLMAVF
jgi:hypothetical protein